MKAPALVTASFLVFATSSLLLMAQETPPTPTSESVDSAKHHRVKIRINGTSVNVDSTHTFFNDNDSDLNFDMDVDVDNDFDFDFDSSDVDMNGNFNQEEFQQKMEKFQQKMQQFQERMKTWQQDYERKMQEWQQQNGEKMKEFQERLRRGMERMHEQMEMESSSTDDGAHQMFRWRKGDSSVVMVHRLRRRGDALEGNRRAIDSLRLRTEHLRKELNALGRKDSRRADLQRQLNQTLEELGQISALNSQLGAMVFANGDSTIIIANGIFARGDSSGDGQEMSLLAGHARDGGPMENFMVSVMGGTDPSEQGVAPRLMIKTLRFSGDPMTLSPEAMAFNEDAIRMQTSEIVIDGDTVQLADGSQGQTVIRIDHGTSNDGKTQLIIMTVRRGADKDVEKSTSAPTVRDASGYQLGENFPNPANSSTTIDYTLPAAGRATLSIFDNTGRLVKTVVDGEMPAGNHSVVVDASDLPSGLYLYRLVSGTFSESKTMTVAR